MDSSPPAAVSQSPDTTTDDLEDVMALFEGGNQAPENELYLMAAEVSPQPSETSSKEGVWCRRECVCRGGGGLCVFTRKEGALPRIEPHYDDSLSKFQVPMVKARVR